MKYNLKLEHRIELDWDHVTWTEAGKEYLLEYTNAIGPEYMNWMSKEGLSVEWDAFQNNWLTEVLLAAAQVTDFDSGTIDFGFTSVINKHDQVCAWSADTDVSPSSDDLMIGYIGYKSEGPALAEDNPVEEVGEE